MARAVRTQALEGASFPSLLPFHSFLAELCSCPQTLKLVGHSCLSLFFLLDDVLPRYYQHVHYLVVGQKEEDELFPASATHQDAQKKKHLLTRIKQLDQAAFSASRTTSDVGTAKDVLTAEIVRSCNNLLEVDVDPVMNQEGCLHKTLCILWSARLANLQGIRLTASPPLAEHADAILASSQSSLSLGRLSLDLGDDRPLHNLTVRLLILLQSLKQLKDLDIDIVFSGILGSVRLDAPVKRLRLELSDGIPLLSLKQFLEPIRYTLRRLVLANFRCGVDFEGTNFPTLNLPSLSDLILYDGQASPLPLKLFPFSPIQHIYLDECLLYYLPKLLSTIQPFVNTLQTFSFGERVIVAQSYEVKQTQTTVNAIKGWLAAHEVDNNFPAEVLTPDKARWRFW